MTPSSQNRMSITTESREILKSETRHVYGKDMYNLLVYPEDGDARFLLNSGQTLPHGAITPKPLSKNGHESLKSVAWSKL
jgi:hypothetical protein